MPLALSTLLMTFLMNYSGPAQAAPKSFFKSISAQFDLIDPTTKNPAIRLSFDGRFGEKLTASIEKLPPPIRPITSATTTEALKPIEFPTCEYSAEFKEVIIDKEKGLQFYLTTTCNENSQKLTTQHSRILIKESKILSFSKSVYLSKTYPQITLKTKDISY